MNRPRNRKNKALPDNLYLTHQKGGKEYFVYRHPVTGKRTGFGTDRQKALGAARQLNQLLGAGHDLIARVVGAAHPTKDYLLRFRDIVLPARRIKGHPLSDTTIAEYNRLINNLIGRFGHRDLTDITQAEIAAFLSEWETAETYNRYRFMLAQIYRHAVSDGIAAENIPEKILRRDKEKTKRQRLSLDGYHAIFQHATRAIRNAMELSLNSLQRRTDIQKWRFDDERPDGYVYMIQSKTRKHGPSAYIRIPITLPTVHSDLGSKTLGEVIARCRDEIVCPFILHEGRERRRRNKEKEHWAQITRKQISDGFAEAREKSGIYNHLEPSARPTFHELISLGEHLRQKAGWEIKQIQALRGHASERMTRHYLDGHEWTTITAPSGARK